MQFSWRSLVEECRSCLLLVEIKADNSANIVLRPVSDVSEPTTAVLGTVRYERSLRAGEIALRAPVNRCAERY